MGINLAALKNAKGLSVTFADVDAQVDGQKEKEFRQQLGFTQSFMACLLHVSTKTIEKWEEGDNPIKGGDAVLLFLLMNQKTLVRRLVTVSSFNGEQVPANLAPYEVSKDLKLQTIDLAYTDPIFEKHFDYKSDDIHEKFTPEVIK